MNNSTVNFTTLEASTNSFCSVNRVDVFLYSIYFLLGLPTHSYVLWLIVTCTKSGVELEFFNLNLSVCELGNCLNCLFYVLNTCFSFLHFKRVVWFLLALGVTGRPVFQCLMCVERYLAVVHPVTFLKYKPLRYRAICCTAAWIITLVCCLLSMFSLDLIDDFLYPWFFLLQFPPFLSIQLFCLVAVLRALKQSGPGERKREKEENHMKRRAFQIILITTVTMSVIYIPFIISGISIILTKQRIKTLFYFGFICYVLGGFVQPVLYLHRAGKLSRLCCS